MRRFALWGLAVGLLGGCTITPQQETEEVAAVVCKCEVVDLPSAQQACIEQLVSQIGTISQACYDCVDAHQTDCTTLTMQCESACATQATPGGS